MDRRRHINQPYRSRFLGELGDYVRPGDCTYKTSDPIPDNDTVEQPPRKSRWSWVWDNGLGIVGAALALLLAVIGWDLLH